MSTTQKFGITSFGGYIPRLRIQRAVIAAAHQWMAPSLRAQAKGRRAFCSWDEDSVTLAVEAARDALSDRPREELTSLTMASTTQPFAEFQSSTLVAEALGLRSTIRTLDLGHSQRAATSGLIAAFRQAEGSSLFIAADRPRGKPASTQEINFGAGAAAFTLGTENVIATLVTSVSKSVLFADHFRADGARYDYYWEERWIRDEGYGKLVVESVASALKQANLTPADIKHFVLAAPFKGVAAAVMKKIGIAPEAEADGLELNCGFSGSAHSLLMLAHQLEKTQPNEHIMLVGFGQGVDVLVLRTTDNLKSFSPRRGVSVALADAQDNDAYLRFASHEKSIELEWGMRGEKSLKTAFTEQYRSSNQLSNFVAGECKHCGTVQFPQLPYCVNPACNAPRVNFEPHPLFDEPAKVLTYTGDWLTYHLAPPLYVGFVQFASGARVLMEMADIGPSGIEVGTPMRMAFRIKDTDQARGYSRYFWKATPIQA